MGEHVLTVTKKGRKHTNGCILPDEYSLDDYRYGTDKLTRNVVAIDFGTTCCSLAYCMRGDRDRKIRYLELEYGQPRIPTAILIGDDGKIVFGKLAYTKYSRMSSVEQRANHFFYKFKMTLQHDEVSGTQF